MSELEALKTKDLKCKKSGVIIKCTGNADLLMCRHGLVIETEGDYSDLEGVEAIDGPEGSMFKNGLLISIGSITRSFEHVERIRPEGFVSDNCNGELLKLEYTIDAFEEKYKKELSEPKIQQYNIGDGITIAVDTGSLFDLAAPAVLTKNTEEIVKRIKIPYDLLLELTRDGRRGEEFFRLIKEQMTRVNCPHYTFQRPDGEDILAKFSKFDKEVELRAYGLRQKD